MTMLRIDREGAGLKTIDLAAAKAALGELKNGTGKGNDFIGWVKLPKERRIRPCKSCGQKSKGKG